MSQCDSWWKDSILYQKMFAYAPHFTLRCVYVESLCLELNPLVHCRNSCKASVCWFTNCFWCIYISKPLLWVARYAQCHTVKFPRRELISSLVQCMLSLFSETVTGNFTHCAMTENWTATIYIISEHEKAGFLWLLDVIHLCHVLISVFESWFFHASYLALELQRKQPWLRHPSRNMDWKHYVVPGMALGCCN